MVLWPKCLTASRAFLGPRRSTVLVPLGARSASWSKVMHSPPAARMRARAVSVNRRAQTEYKNIARGRDGISDMRDGTPASRSHTVKQLITVTSERAHTAYIIAYTYCSANRRDNVSSPWHVPRDDDFGKPAGAHCIDHCICASHRTG